MLSSVYNKSAKYDTNQVGWNDTRRWLSYKLVSALIGVPSKIYLAH